LEYHVPFRYGQVFERIYQGRSRQAIVLKTRSDGQEALLRYVDTRSEEWTGWPDFDADEWQWTGGEK
jgi:hypothetical protein